MSKWEKFNNSYSSVDISKANTGASNFQADWSRESTQGRMKINGIPIQNYAQQFDGFNSEESVEAFFKAVILKDMQTLSEDKTSEIVDCLKKTFHQGGFMYPVSSSLAVSMKTYDEDLDIEEPFATVKADQMDVSINIVTHKNGFKVQEFVAVKELIIIDLALAEQLKMDEGNPMLSPKQGFDYIIKTSGTIDIDFSSNAKDPSVTIENNMISYGYSEIASKMDNRHIGQIIVDFFRNILHFNQVKDISPNAPQSMDAPAIEVVKGNDAEIIEERELPSLSI